MSSKSTRPEAGRLSLVATPIGCLEDMTLRALRVLREADVVLAEDTRHTRALLQHHGVATPMRSFHAHTGPNKRDKLVEELLGGAHFALVTDAGTPIVSDPGAELVAAAVEVGVRVEPIPGPSAVTAALTVAGLRCDTFRFVGFVPRSGSRRKKVLAELAKDRSAIVLFESPRRLAATLREFASTFGERRLAVCRELTKLHEEVLRGTAAELAEHFAEGARGEITIVVEADDTAGVVAAPTAEVISGRVEELLADGLSTKEIAKQVSAELGIPRRVAYQAALGQSNE